jgi:hypothetical protein
MNILVSMYHLSRMCKCGILRTVCLHVHVVFLAQNDIDATSTLDYDTFRTAADMRLRIFAVIDKGKLTPVDQNI